MPDLKSICPVCDKDITITEMEVRIATMHMKETGGKAIIGCPECCHVLVLPYNKGQDLAEWIAGYDTPDGDNWLTCLPLLDAMDAKMPNGFVEHLGIKWWTPGDETQAIPASKYMMQYGIVPAYAWNKMGHK